MPALVRLLNSGMGQFGGGESLELVGSHSARGVAEEVLIYCHSEDFRHLFLERDEKEGC